jgi:hypothetical protein
LVEGTFVVVVSFWFDMSVWWPVALQWDRVVFFLLGVLVLLASLPCWVQWMVAGIAYGDLVGIPGGEAALARLGARGYRWMLAAVALSVLGVGVLSWAVTPRAWRWYHRTGPGLGLGGFLGFLILVGMAAA